MKQLLATLLLAPLLALSQSSPPTKTWHIIEESEDGSVRLFVREGSLNVGRNVNGVPVASGTFAIVNKGERTETGAALALQSCIDGSGELVIMSQTSGPVRFWWDQKGTRIFDVTAKTICAGVVERERQLRDNRSTRL